MRVKFLSASSCTQLLDLTNYDEGMGGGRIDTVSKVKLKKEGLVRSLPVALF